MIKITCTSCNKPLSIDETKLPMKEVSFPCPLCKTKLTLDRRNLAAADAPAAEAASPAGSDQPAPLPPEEEEDNSLDRRALLVGADSDAIRAAVRAIGYAPIYRATAAEAREYYVQEFPELVVLSPTKPSPPPLEEMIPITSVMPIDRRKGFFMLVGDNLRTLDGNAAFLYQVNVVVATKDLGAMSRVFHDAWTYHRRLYQPMRAVSEE